MHNLVELEVAMVDEERGRRHEDGEHHRVECLGAHVAIEPAQHEQKSRHKDHVFKYEHEGAHVEHIVISLVPITLAKLDRFWGDDLNYLRHAKVSVGTQRWIVHRPVGGVRPLVVLVPLLDW